MICVTDAAITAKSKRLPWAYFQDCKAVAHIKDGQWCFEPADYLALREKYRGYAVSESDQFREGEIISGCCDRADQY